jgi:hypothetical protein
MGQLNASTALPTRYPLDRSKKRRDRSVGIATGYGLDYRGIRVQFSAGARDFLLS